MKSQLSILLVAATLVTSLSAAPQMAAKTSMHILCTRPQDAGPTNLTQKNDWFVALADALVRFRLEPIRQLRVESFNEISRSIPELQQLGTPVADARYADLAGKLGSTHLVNQKFEIDNKSKAIHYYIEVLRWKDRQITASIESALPFEQLAQSLDSSLLVLVAKLGAQITPEIARFFQIPVLSANFKNVKALGEIIVQDRFTTDRNDEDLAQEYEKIIQRDPFLLLGNYFCGQACFRARDYAKAAKYIKELLDLTPIHTNLYLGLAQSYRLAGRHEDALVVAMQCEKMRLNTVPFLLEKALALENLGRHGSALGIHNQILTLDPRQQPSLLFLARQRNNEGRAKDALAFADKLLKLSPENGHGHYERGRSAATLSQFDKALASFQTAARLLPDDPGVFELLGDLHARKGTFTQASSAYQKAISLRPDYLELHLKMARSLESAGKAADAIAQLRQIESKFPAQQGLMKSIGLLEFATGDLKKCQEHLETYASANAKDADVAMTLGQVYARTNQLDKALTTFEAALPMVADKHSCRLAIARVLLDKKDARRAMKYLKDILAENPVKHAFRTMGDAFALTGDTQNALSHYLRERDLHGEDAYVQERISSIQFQRGSVSLARAEFNRLLKIDPSNARAYFHIAIIAMKDGDAGAAQANLTKAESCGKGDARVYFLLGNAFAGAKLFDKAIDAYQKCLALESTKEDALLNLATAQINADKDSAAAETFLKIFAHDNSRYADYLARAGHLFRKLSLNAKAKNAYELFLSKGGSDFHVNAGLARIVYSEKDYKRVTTLLKNPSGSLATDEDVLMMLAHAYCRTEQHALAIPLLKNVIRQNPKQQFATELSAIAHEKTGNMGQAIRMYEECLNFPYSENHANMAFHLAELYVKQSANQQAISRLAQNVREYPDDLRNHELLASIYMKAAEWQKAQQVLTAAVEFPQASPGLQKMLAQTLAERNDKAGAAQLYKVYLARAGSDSNAWQELGKIYFSQKLYSEAIGPLTKATELMPKNFDCLYMLGASHVESGNLSKAVAPLGRALGITKTSIPVYELIARCYRSLKETSSLVATLQSWIQLDPKRYDIRFELGSLYIANRRLPEAVAVLNESVKLNPAIDKPHLLLAQAFEMLGNDSLRIHHLTSAVRFAPRNWEAHFQIAKYYFAKNRSSDAEPHLRRTIELNPLSGSAHYEYGAMLQEHGDFAAAYAELGRAIELEPNNPLFLAQFAYVASMTGKKKEASEHVAVAMGKESSNAKVLYWASLVYNNAGQRETARQTIKEALTRDPDFVPSYEALGDFHFEESQFRDAARLYFLAWEKGGYNEGRALKLGKALAYAGKHLEAKDFFETILTKNPGHEEVLFRLTDSYCELGDIKSARKVAKSFKQSKKMVWMQLAQGRLYEAEGKFDAAWIAYNVAMRLAGDNPYVHAGYGRMYLQREMFDSAAASFSAALVRDSVNMRLALDIGKAYRGLGQQESASHYFASVAAKYPEHPEVHLMIAQLKSEQKDHRGAIRSLENGIKYHPKDPNHYFALGREFEKMDQFEKAIDSYQSALKKGKSQHVEAFRFIGNIYYHKLVNDKKAREFYKRYVKAGGKNEDVAEVIRKLEGI